MGQERCSSMPRSWRWATTLLAMSVAALSIGAGAATARLRTRARDAMENFILMGGRCWKGGLVLDGIEFVDCLELEL